MSRCLSIIFPLALSTKRAPGLDLCASSSSPLPPAGPRPLAPTHHPTETWRPQCPPWSGVQVGFPSWAPLACVDTLDPIHSSAQGLWREEGLLQEWVQWKAARSALVPRATQGTRGRFWAPAQVPSGRELWESGAGGGPESRAFLFPAM